MKMKLLSQTINIRPSAWFIFVYAIIDSLFINSEVGVVGIILLLFCVFNYRHDKNAYRVSYILSLLFIVGAVFVNFFDGSGIFRDAIRTMSVWVYFMMLVGVVQLFIVSRLKE